MPIKNFSRLAAILLQSYRFTSISNPDLNSTTILSSYNRCFFNRFLTSLSSNSVILPVFVLRKSVISFSTIVRRKYIAGFYFLRKKGCLLLIPSYNFTFLLIKEVLCMKKLIISVLLSDIR